MPPNLLNILRDRVASVFCCSDTPLNAAGQATPVAASLRHASNASRITEAVTEETPPRHEIELNDDDKKNIVRQFHCGLTRSRYPNGTSRTVIATGKTLAALSAVDKSWRAACEDEYAVARVSDDVIRNFRDNFDSPIASIQFIDQAIKDASLRGQAALEIVDAALRRSVSEADEYTNFMRPKNQRQEFPYAEILSKVLDLDNVDPKIMNSIITKACNIFWKGPTFLALGKYDYARLEYSTTLLNKMLSHVEHDLPDASTRVNPLVLRAQNIQARAQVFAKWPTLCEMTKVAAGIYLCEGADQGKAALTKILDCAQRAPHQHRINLAVGVAAYSNAFLDRRSYLPFTNGVASHVGETTVDFIFAGIKERLSKSEYNDFVRQLQAETTINNDVKQRAYIL